MMDTIAIKEIKKTKLKKNILIPEIKIKTNQLKPIKSVWPISGWSIKRPDIKIVNKKDNKYLKLRLAYLWEQIIILMITIKKGLTNSIGCILGNINKSIHLLEPLTSMPMIGTKTKESKEIKKNIIEYFINCSFLKEENIKTINIPIKTYIKCLKKKK